MSRDVPLFLSTREECHMMSQMTTVRKNTGVFYRQLNRKVKLHVRNFLVLHDKYHRTAKIMMPDIRLNCA